MSTLTETTNGVTNGITNGHTDEPLYQDVMGQFPQLKTYNHGLAMFPKSDDVSRESVVEAVEAATAKIIAKIPWLAQQVVHEEGGSGDSGTYKLAPWPSDAPRNTLVRVKDCSDLLPSHDEILGAKGPATMFPGDIICPVPGFPMRYDEKEIGPAPAVVTQINWIKGGLIIVFSNQHNVMDGSGMFQFIAMLATAMNGDEISESAVKNGNLDRSTVVPLFRPDEPIRDHSHFLVKNAPPSLNKEPLAPCSWKYFKLWRSAVPKIKAAASDLEGSDPNVPFISSNDALSAFFWKRMALARVRLGMDPQAKSKFSRAIDARAAMGISHEYMGQMVYFSPTWLTYQELVDLPLSSIAVFMRKALNEANTEYSVRSYATFVANIKDKTEIAYAGPFNRKTDIASSSMAQAAVVLKFGILGIPNLIRRPTLAPIPGTFYFYPPEADGNLNVLVCLNDAEIQALKEDPEWSECAEYVG